MNVIEEILQLFQKRGHEEYFGEPVSQLEHALQTAALAEQAGASHALIAAAVLHDIGHLVHGLPETIAAQGVDGRHEVEGERWLAARFGIEVTEPVRLHVAAKRYLCRVDQNYRESLSPASLQSLQLQGGPFDAESARTFESNPFFSDAVELRRWDDKAKAPGLRVPDLDHYRAILEAALSAGSERRRQEKGASEVVDRY